MRVGRLLATLVTLLLASVCSLPAQAPRPGRAERLIRLWLDAAGLQPSQIVTKPGLNHIVVVDRLSSRPAEFQIVPETNPSGRRLATQRLGPASPIDRRREYHAITLTPGRYILTTPGRSARRTIVIVQP